MRSTEADRFMPLVEAAADITGQAGETANAHYLSAAYLDQSLIAQIRQQDVSAFALLYDRHAARLYTLAMYSTGDAGAAEQIVVDVFQTIWEDSDSFTAGTDVASWLLHLTRQRAIALLRGATQQPRALVGRAEPLEPVPVLGQYAALKIRQSLQELPQEQRTSVELAYYSGLSQGEIAAQLEQPLSKVQRNLREGLLSLREQLFGD